MLLELLQFADSALPIGAAAHSFGLETLIEDGVLSPQNLLSFLQDHLQQTGVLEATFLRRAWRGEALTGLSAEFDARRPARESRDASFKMGRRFVELSNALCGFDLPLKLHYPIAFGAAAVRLQIPEEPAVIAYLQQSCTSLISASQRLMPLGQLAASRILWSLRASITQAAASSEALELSCFTPLPELASMRHSLLETRLFIS